MGSSSSPKGLNHVCCSPIGWLECFPRTPRGRIEPALKGIQTRPSFVLLTVSMWHAVVIWHVLRELERTESTTDHWQPCGWIYADFLKTET